MPSTNASPEPIIVKVQLPIDQTLARFGKAFADQKDRNLMVYDEKRTVVFRGFYPELYEYMLKKDGHGYIKAYMWAVRVGRRWNVDLERGFAPMQPW